MTRDLGEEFLEQGQQLMEANQYESAVEHLSWAKSLSIHHDNLMFSNDLEQIEKIIEPDTSTERRRVWNPPSISIRQPRPSEKLMQIHQLSDIAEKQMKPQSRNDSDQVRKIITTIGAFTPNTLLSFHAEKSILKV
jgi:hypothetical protein